MGVTPILTLSSTLIRRTGTGNKDNTEVPEKIIQGVPENV
jgi:hypothetical protein